MAVKKVPRTRELCRSGHGLDKEIGRQLKTHRVGAKNAGLLFFGQQIVQCSGLARQHGILQEHGKMHQHENERREQKKPFQGNADLQNGQGNR